MSSCDHKRALFGQFAAVARAMAHEHRLELLELLAQGERSVEELAERSGLSVANASQHLQQLKRAGLAASRRQAKFTLYRLADDSVLSMLSAMHRVAETQLGEVDRILRTHFDRYDDLAPVTRAELLQMLNDGAVTILDVRPEDEFAAGHVAGAINIPIERLSQALPKLNLKDEIVAYCRGPYCVLAFEAVNELRKRGLKARRMEGGFPQWKVEGLPISAKKTA